MVILIIKIDCNKGVEIQMFGNYYFEIRARLNSMINSKVIKVFRKDIGLVGEI